ncbi:hypothetical protein ETB97_008204 [Aspergillus alliaceus]|uniref:Carboxylesterase type B domain-containing protein n=1 Tax=Petromyces alliaceus TaxID=209559 RepID=A0A8H6ABM3_PETAA|nr:hypothetical protein ETB97_008204 [Aspergillus burnettii]
MCSAELAPINYRSLASSSQVTVVGQSVGASDVSLQLHRLVEHKKFPFSTQCECLNFNTMLDLVAYISAIIPKQVGCATEDDAQSLGTLECLREVPFHVLTNLSFTASREARPPFGEGFFSPTFDVNFIHGRPSQLLRAVKFVKGTPVIASWMTNDGAWYVTPTTSTDQEVLDSFGLWLFGLSNSTKKKLLQLYSVEGLERLVREEYDGPISAHYYRAA